MSYKISNWAALVFLGLCFSLPVFSQAATYYVSVTDGDDANCTGLASTAYVSGSAQACPWKTIAKVNSASFSPGDSILFKSGETWRELLTVPSSGTSGSPITFGAYGTGSTPVISGGDLISSWARVNYDGPELFTDPGLETWTNSTTLTNWAKDVAGTSAVNQETSIIHGGSNAVRFNVDSSGSAVDIGQFVTLAANTQYTISFYHQETGSSQVQVEVQDRTGGANNNFYVTTDGLTWSSGAKALLAPANAVSYTKAQITFTTTSAGQYKVYFARWSPNSASQTMYLDDVSIKATGAGSPIPNPVYRASVSWTPIDLFEDAAHDTSVAFNTDIFTTASAMSAGTWSYDAGSKFLYVWTKDGGDPSTHTIIAPNRANSINLNSKNYITVDGLTLNYSSDRGLDGMGNYDTVQNLTSYSNYNYGIRTQGTGGVVYNCVAYDNNVGIGGTGTSTLVKNNISHDNNHIANSDGFSFFSTTNLLLEYNKSYNNNNGGSADGFQIALGTSTIVRYNTAYDNSNSNIILTTGASNVSYGSIYDNLVYGSTGRGITVTSDNGETDVYNNTIYGATVYGLRLSSALHGGTMIAKNNVVYGSTPALSVAAGTQAALTSDYNLFYRPTAGTLIDYNSVSYSNSQFANYQAASSQDTHSLSIDPSFTNIGGNDFTLQTGSPAIDVGIDLGDTYKLALAPGSTWPSSISTLDQNNEGLAWDIGAYAYSTPVVLASLSSPTFLPAGTTSSTLTVTTPSAATCRYGTTNLPYVDLTLFPTTGGTTHSLSLTGLTNNHTYTYYVACQYTGGNTTATEALSFATGQGTSISSGYSGSSGGSGFYFSSPAANSPSVTSTASSSLAILTSKKSSPTLLQLLAQLQVLQAELHRLQLLAISPTTLASDLAIHPNPRLIQETLNFLGYPVAKTGPGSPGRETNFFGPLTRAALIKFQVAQGIIPSAYSLEAGYFGPKTKTAFIRNLKNNKN